MSIKRIFLLGFLIWGAMFVVVSLFMATRIYAFEWAKFLIVIGYGILSYRLAAYIKANEFLAALHCAVIWLAINAVLDALITRFVHAEAFYPKNLACSYILLLIGPMLWGYEHKPPRRSRVEGVSTWL